MEKRHWHKFSIISVSCHIKNCHDLLLCIIYILHKNAKKKKFLGWGIFGQNIHSALLFRSWMWHSRTVLRHRMKSTTLMMKKEVMKSFPHSVISPLKHNLHSTPLSRHLQGVRVVWEGIPSQSQVGWCGTYNFIIFVSVVLLTWLKKIRSHGNILVYVHREDLE